MNYCQGTYLITKKDNIAKGCYSFWIYCPEMAALAEAGQFVHVRIGSHTLRRPISICEINKEKGELRIVFEIRGQGTDEIANIPAGGQIDLLGPLGNGFDGPTCESDSVLVIGGGIGVPPMLQTAKAFGKNATAIIGFRNASAVILEDDFKKNGINTILCTDDGSKGVHGYVTTALEQQLKEQKPSLICACGPAVMLKTIVKLADEYGIRCQVSLEERMGCGVGACLVCACKSVKDGKEYYAHVCKDGPVFDSHEVIL